MFKNSKSNNASSSSLHPSQVTSRVALNEQDRNFTSSSFQSIASYLPNQPHMQTSPSSTSISTNSSTELLNKTSSSPDSTISQARAARLGPYGLQRRNTIQPHASLTALQCATSCDEQLIADSRTRFHDLMTRCGLIAGQGNFEGSPTHVDEDIANDLLELAFNSVQKTY